MILTRLCEGRHEGQHEEEGKHCAKEFREAHYLLADLRAHSSAIS